jgi:prepilin-type processing-associated H-X9-DG protein/prepilin-type N-terminal cleavage/methylation domain-containing protein
MGIGYRRRLWEVRAREAFTLLELLIVIAILSLLVSILLPSLGRARDLARSAVCMSNVRQLALASVTYECDHGRLVPYSQFDPGITNTSGGQGVNVRWCWSDDTPGDPEQAFRNGLLSPYLGKCTKIAGCPSYQTPDNIINFYRTFGLAYPVAVHYGYNGLLLGERHDNFFASNPSTPGYRTWVGYRREEIARPSSTVMFADSGQFQNSQVVPTPTIYPPLTVQWPNGSDRARPDASVHGRHPGGKANVAWVDGHVSSEKVRIYEDQPDGQRSAGLGFLAPEGADRSNEWMVAK